MSGSIVFTEVALIGYWIMLPSFRIFLPFHAELTVLARPISIRLDLVDVLSGTTRPGFEHDTSPLTLASTHGRFVFVHARRYPRDNECMVLAVIQVERPGSRSLNQREGLIMILTQLIRLFVLYRHYAATSMEKERVHLVRGRIFGKKMERLFRQRVDILK